jgi:hypothetical protein
LLAAALTRTFGLTVEKTMAPLTVSEMHERALELDDNEYDEFGKSDFPQAGGVPGLKSSIIDVYEDEPLEGGKLEEISYTLAELEGLDNELFNTFMEKMQAREVRVRMKEWSPEEKWEFSHLMANLVNDEGGANLGVLSRALQFLKDRQLEIDMGMEIPKVSDEKPIPRMSILTIVW